MEQYCGGYIEGGIEKPYLLSDGTPGPWSKGFICEEGLVCQVRFSLRGGINTMKRSNKNEWVSVFSITRKWKILPVEQSVLIIFSAQC